MAPKQKFKKRLALLHAQYSKADNNCRLAYCRYLKIERIIESRNLKRQKIATKIINLNQQEIDKR